MADISFTVGVEHSQLDSAIKKIGSLEGTVLSAAIRADLLKKQFEFLDRALNTGKISAQAYGRLVTKLDKSEEELYRSLENTNGAIKRQATVTKQALVATRAYQNQVSTLNKTVNQYGVVANNATIRTKRFASFGLQQVGYQVGDFAVQVQGGTNALVALGQQGAQLLGIFGAWGAIAGAILAISTAILNVRSSTTKMTFAFDRFWKDFTAAFEPIQPVIDNVVLAFKWLGNQVINAVNLIINSVRAIIVVVGALPEAFSRAIDWVSSYLRIMELRVEATTYLVQSKWQAMMDTITGSTPMVSTLIFNPDGSISEGQITVAEKLREAYAALTSQADALKTNVDNAGGAASAITDAFRDFKAIDIRDYFERVSEAVSGGGGNSLTSALTEAQERIKKLAESFQSTLEDGFMSIVDGTKSVKEAFKSMASDIIKELYRVLVVQRLVGSFDVKTGSGSGIVGAIFSAFQANGGVWNKGVQMFANGGVVGSPTMFPMSGGRTGLMGEAGPEAIMPLKRGSDGKLGVEASGGGNVTVIQNFNIAANGDESVKRIVRAETPRMAEAAKAAVLDSKRRGGAYGRSF